MAKKSLGYVHLEWTCPNCGTLNKGTEKLCTNCFAPQPEDVQFEQSAQEDMITDAKTIEEAKAGPDIHCGFCGTRNPAGTAVCSQCGADLSEGTARQRGRVVGAHKDEAAPDVDCPYCGQKNPATAVACQHCGSSLAETREKLAVEGTAVSTRKNRKPLIIGLIIVAIIACAALSFLFFRTEDQAGSVQSVHWTRTIYIEELGPVQHENWVDEIPSAALVGTCQERIHHTQDSPAPNSVEVCGTPYTVDEGSGLGEVVQDCEYEVYEDWCQYTVEEWTVVDSIIADGDDFAPQWPEAKLSSGQRQGSQEENYQVLFDADGADYTYSTNDFQKYTLYKVGSRWILKVNTFNIVTDIESAE